MQAKIGGNAMSKQDDGLKEIIRGLDGLVMLGQWQATLARELLGRAQVLDAFGEQPEPPGKPGDADAE
jgi:hypothetical protein